MLTVIMNFVALNIDRQSIARRSSSPRRAYRRHQHAPLPPSISNQQPTNHRRPGRARYLSARKKIRSRFATSNQKLIPCTVPQGVVDALEEIKIEKQQRKPGYFFGGILSEALAPACLEQAPIGRPVKLVKTSCLALDCLSAFQNAGGQFPSPVMTVAATGVQKDDEQSPGSLRTIGPPVNARLPQSLHDQADKKRGVRQAQEENSSLRKGRQANDGPAHMPADTKTAVQDLI